MRRTARQSECDGSPADAGAAARPADRLLGQPRGGCGRLGREGRTQLQPTGAAVRRRRSNRDRLVARRQLHLRHRRELDHRVEPQRGHRRVHLRRDRDRRCRRPDRRRRPGRRSAEHDRGAISADGKNVYATGWQSDNAVAVFARDAATGKLTFLEREKDGVNDPTDAGGTVDFMFRPEGVAVAQDGNTVYAVSSSDDSIVGFTRATRPPASSATSRPRWTPSTTPVTRVGPWTGCRAPVASPWHRTTRACTCRRRPTIRSSPSSATRVPQAQLSRVRARRRQRRRGCGRNGGRLNGASAVTVSPGNNAVFATGGFESAVAVFARDTATEKLSFIEAERDGTDETDPNDPGPAVTAFCRRRTWRCPQTPKTSMWPPEQRRRRGVPLVSPALRVGLLRGGERTASTMARMPAASSRAARTERGHANARWQARIRRDRLRCRPRGVRPQADGAVAGHPELHPVAPQLSLSGPRGVAVAPDGKHVLLATLGDESVRSFTRNQATGAVSLADNRDGRRRRRQRLRRRRGRTRREPKAVAVSPDGAHVYVTDTSTYSISTFTPNGTTGELSYVGSIIDPDPGDIPAPSTGLRAVDVVHLAQRHGCLRRREQRARAISLHPEPGHRQLTFVEAEFDGVGGVDGLNGTEGIAISPDGPTCTRAARNEQKASVFSRNPATNALTFLEVEQDGVNDPTDPAAPWPGSTTAPTTLLSRPMASRCTSSRARRSRSSIATPPRAS